MGYSRILLEMAKAILLLALEQLEYLHGIKLSNEYLPTGLEGVLYRITCV